MLTIQDLQQSTTTQLNTTEHTAASIADRNALTNLLAGDNVFVTDASTDASVENGWAIYRYRGTGTSGTYIDADFNKVGEQESLDVHILKWANSVINPIEDSIATLTNPSRLESSITFEPDKVGLYSLRVFANTLTGGANPTAGFMIGTATGLDDVVPITPTAERITNANPSKYYSIELEAGTTYHVSLFTGDGSTATDLGFQLAPISRMPWVQQRAWEPATEKIVTKLQQSTTANFTDYGAPNIDLDDLIDGDRVIIEFSNGDLSEGTFCDGIASVSRGANSNAQLQVLTGGQIQIRHITGGGSIEEITILRTLRKAQAVSTRIGELFHKSSLGPPIQGHLAITPGTVANGALDYPIWASMYPWFVVNDDIVFPTDVQGMFLRNLGGVAGGEGVFQPDMVGPHTHPYTDRRGTGFVGRGNGGNVARSGNFATDNKTTSINAGTANHPRNRAFQLYTIVDNAIDAWLGGIPEFSDIGMRNIFNLGDKLYSVIDPELGGKRDLTSNQKDLTSNLNGVEVVNGLINFSSSNRAQIDLSGAGTLQVWVYARLRYNDAQDNDPHVSIFNNALNTYIPLASAGVTDTEIYRVGGVVNDPSGGFSIDGVDAANFANRGEVYTAIATGNFFNFEYRGLLTGQPLEIGRHHQNDSFTFDGDLQRLVVLKEEPTEQEKLIVYNFLEGGSIAQADLRPDPPEEAFQVQVGDEYRPTTPIDINTTDVTLPFDLTTGDTLEILTQDTTGDFRQWPSSDIDLTELIDKRTAFMHTFHNDYIIVSLVNPGDEYLGKLRFTDAGRQQALVSFRLLKYSERGAGKKRLRHNPVNQNIAAPLSITLGYDLNTIDTLEFLVRDTATPGRQWPIQKIDVPHLLSTGSAFANVWNNAHLVIVVVNATTGELNITESNRDMWLVSVDGFVYGDGEGQTLSSQLDTTAALATLSQTNGPTWAISTANPAVNEINIVSCDYRQAGKTRYYNLNVLMDTDTPVTFEVPGAVMALGASLSGGLDKSAPRFPGCAFNVSGLNEITLRRDSAETTILEISGAFSVLMA